MEGVETEVKRGKVEIVEAGASPDATIDISYRLVPKADAAPAELTAFFRSKADDDVP